MTIFSVSNSEELMNALASATGGDTIELAGGDYGQLDLITFQTFGIKAIYDSPVTITSADTENRASFSGMDLREVKNLTFDNVIFDSDHSGGTLWVAPFRILNSEGITIRNSLFQGELASGTGDPTIDGFATGKGLVIEGGSGIVIENNEFTTWHRALTVGDSIDVEIVGNEVHSIRSDGMNFVGVNNVLIEDNYFHDFQTSVESSDHADMIQFWTTGTTVPSTDIIIRGNTLDVGDGGTTQSIFIRNEMVDRGLAGEEMFYQNIFIEENVILNNHTHGITVGETDGLIIRNNTVLDANASILSSVATPKINISSLSKNVVIEQNVSAAINGYSNQLDWSVLSNVLVQNIDPNAAGYYEKEFINSSMGGGVNGYLVDPSGTIAQLGAGASRLYLDTNPADLRTEFEVSSEPDKEDSLVFDASYTFGPTGKVADADAQFIWDFGDGTGAAGQVVRHVYSDPGRYEVTLTVITADGESARATSEIGIKGADALSYDSLTGLFQFQEFGVITPIEGTDRASVSIDGGYGIDLGGAGSVVSVDKSQISRLFGAESFDMSMTLRADVLGSTGEVARVHTNFLLSIAPRGEVSLELSTDTEYKKLITTGATVNDGADHDIRVSFDGETNSLMIYVDGKLAGATEVEGKMRIDFPRNLDFGNPWGTQNFDGTLTAFYLEVGAQDYPDYTGAVLPISDTETKVAEEDTTVVAAEDEVGLDGDAAEDNGQDNTSTGTDTATPELNLPPIESTEDPVLEPEEESTLPEFLLKGGFKLDFTNIQNTNTITFHDNAHVVTTPIGTAITFDGKKDYVSLGRLTDFEDSQKIAFSVDFMSDSIKGGAERLVWNHVKVGLTLEADGIRVHAANEDDEQFSSGFKVSGLDLHDGNRHNVTVMVDAEADRLQVVVDDILVLDEQDTDFNFVGAGGHEWGWSLGTAWNRWFDGEVYDFQVSNDFDFIETTGDEGALLV